MQTALNNIHVAKMEESQGGGTSVGSSRRTTLLLRLATFSFKYENINGGCVIEKIIILPDMMYVAVFAIDTR